jgi:hypothetical protein
MIFGLFGSNKKRENVADLLAEFVTYQQLVGHISKAQSLQSLNRVDDARKVLREAERMATNYLSQNPREKEAHMMLVLFYSEVGEFDQAEQIIQRLLSSGEFQLNDDERLILSAELQKLQRQRPANQRAPDGPSGFTQIYCCANCGRLHNFVSMPCPHCDWSPQTIDETARSIILSNSHFNVPALLTLAREMQNGRTAGDVAPNLLNDGKAYLSVPKQKQVVEHVFTMLRQNEHKNHRSLSMIRECSDCGSRILFSDAEKCAKCGEPVNWPDAVRTLACMDNLLWLLEQRVEVSSSDPFSDFVCVLVAMTNNLLRKQEVPSIRERQYSLQLLTDMGAVCDLNKGAVIDTKNPKDLKIYLIKDSMREDSESFGLFLIKELAFFVAKMVDGVRN